MLKRMWKKGNICILWGWWECKLMEIEIGPATVKISMTILQKLRKNYYMIQLLQFWVFIRSIQKYSFEKIYVPYPHSSIIYNSQDMDTT